MKPVELPRTAERPPGKEGVGTAVQSFYSEQMDACPSWISGQLTLPPVAIKDAEGVGMCSQVKILMRVCVCVYTALSCCYCWLCVRVYFFVYVVATAALAAREVANYQTKEAGKSRRKIFDGIA